MASLRVSVVLVLLLATNVVHAADVDPPRLKFRSRGPVCSCESGMGEEDIRKAWEARFGTGSTGPAAATPPRDAPPAIRQDSGRREQQKEEGR